MVERLTTIPLGRHGVENHLALSYDSAVERHGRLHGLGYQEFRPRSVDVDYPQLVSVGVVLPRVLPELHMLHGEKIVQPLHRFDDWPESLDLLRCIHPNETAPEAPNLNGHGGEKFRTIGIGPLIPSRSFDNLSLVAGQAGPKHIGRVESLRHGNAS